MENWLIAGLLFAVASGLVSSQGKILHQIFIKKRAGFEFKRSLNFSSHSVIAFLFEIAKCLLVGFKTPSFYSRTNVQL